MNTRVIAIECSPARLAENARNRARLEACRHFERPDRPPVVFSLTSRYVFSARGQDLGDYYDNPRTQLEQQLLNQKWLIEHAIDDRVIDTESVTVSPDLSTLRGGYYDVDIDWYNDGSACAVPILHEPEDIDTLQVPDVHSGHYGRMIRWYHEMKDLALEYTVTLNGKPLDLRVTVGAGGGPIPDAYALAGQNMFLWMVSEPARVHHLMATVTDAFINLQRYVRELRGDSDRGVGLGCDAAEMLSPAMFAEFVVPYYRRCYDAFPGARGFHNCGKIDHLVSTIADELRITHLNGFGFGTDPRLLAQWLGGRAVMSGGLSPMLLLEGPVEAIQRECFRYLQAFANCGGYILQDGNNVAPGTPLEHLQAAVAAVRMFSESMTKG